MRLPNLGGLSLHPVVPTEVGYDPTQGGDGFQGYFADMILDSDRNARYAEAIMAAVRDFKNVEKRPPVVLDAGCGTGLLTLFALVAGAERVLSVDVNQGHINEIRNRLGPELADRCTPMYVGPPNPNPFADPTYNEELMFDLLISEILGTFANSESESKFLPQYAQHMKVHASGNIYCVPHVVSQTMRQINPPNAVQRLAREDFVYKYMPTNLVGFRYEDTDPNYLAEAVVVRVDRFDVIPFAVDLPPSIQLKKGYYAAEWEAVLWPNTEPLRNTWEWARYHNEDEHSVHARSRAWGLMLFYVDTTVTVNYPGDGLDRDSIMPPMRPDDTNGRYEINPDLHVNRLRLTNTSIPNSRAANKLVLKELYEKLRVLNIAETKYEGEDVLHRYISMEAVSIGIPKQVPLAALYRMTVGAIVTLITAGKTGLWQNTQLFVGVLPFIVSEKTTTDWDVGVQLIAPEDAETNPRLRYRYLAVGAGFLLDP